MDHRRRRQRPVLQHPGGGNRRRASRPGKRRAVRSMSAACRSTCSSIRTPSPAWTRRSTRAANARYAASFLLQLFRQSSDWGAAIAGYHSQTPDIGAAYGSRVVAVWPAASTYGVEFASGGHPVVLPIPIEVDPYHVLTPEFRRKLIAEAEFRRVRDRAIGIVPVPAAAPVVPAKSRGRRLAFRADRSAEPALCSACRG